MELILPSEEIYGLVPLWNNASIDACLKFIEKAGRTCYKSEEKMSEGSHINFGGMMLKRRHLTVVEKTNLVIKIGDCVDSSVLIAMDQLKIAKSKYINVMTEDNIIYIGGNVRAWMEQIECFNFDDIADEAVNWVQKVLPSCTCTTCDDHVPIPKEMRRFSIKFIHDRAVTHEMVRHRPCTFLQESQRYVRYDGGMVFIIPIQYRDENIDTMPQRFVDYLEGCELEYQAQRKDGHPPEFARTCLPNCTKTEIVVTADYDEWINVIIPLRTAKSAHGDIRGAINRCVPSIVEAFA